MNKRTNVLAGSHLPLINALFVKDMLEGGWSKRDDVLELGMGNSSTPFLHWMCKATKRNLVSYETDPEWYKVNKEFEEPGHEVHLVDPETGWEEVNLMDRHWSIALVDNRPARKRRSLAQRLKNHCNYIILHDSELADDPAYKYTGIYDQFKYKYEYKMVGKPYCMLLSNFKDLSWLI